MIEPDGSLIGRQIGAYRITARIGAGGMGEVYRARDTRLQRDVAVKVLPAAFALDPDRIARLEREALVLASLSHPNIAIIHGLEEAEGIRALVLELIEGPTLEERIRRPDHLRQGYGGPPKLDAKAEGLRLPEPGRSPEQGRPPERVLLGRRVQLSGIARCACPDGHPPA